MENRYGFNLKFDELSSELQERKIQEYMVWLWNSDKDFYTHEGEFKTVEEFLQDMHCQEDARMDIEARFPIYF